MNCRSGRAFVLFRAVPGVHNAKNIIGLYPTKLPLGTYFVATLHQFTPVGAK